MRPPWNPIVCDQKMRQYLPLRGHHDLGLVSGWLVLWIALRQTNLSLKLKTQHPMETTWSRA